MSNIYIFDWDVVTGISHSIYLIQDFINYCKISDKVRQELYVYVLKYPSDIFLKEQNSVS